MYYDDSGRYDDLHGDEDENDYDALQAKHDREELDYDEFEVYEHD